ncbi:MAG: aldo/keto reductase, partial [Planctomycetes bacterium]|nr:aldo/keto reductase [Planctomycetota bacterium]
LLGDTTGYGRPLEPRPRGKFSSGGEVPGEPSLPHLTVEECVGYTLTCDPDVALLGMSFPNEQTAALREAAGFHPLSADRMADMRRRAEAAIQGKGPCWWNPA